MVAKFRFEDMEIWKMAREYATAIHDVTRTYPDHEKYGLATQTTRSADSICLNIAEGSGRDTLLDFGRFLGIARGSVFEVAAALTLAHDRGYLDQAVYQKLFGQAEQISRTIYRFRENLKP